jgi:hypothetical protein
MGAGVAGAAAWAHDAPAATASAVAICLNFTLRLPFELSFP